jgi:hypothetical protein
MEVEGTNVVHAAPLNYAIDTEENIPRDIPDVSTSLTSDEVDELRGLFDIPTYIDLVLPGKDDRMWNPPPGHICVTDHAFVHGLRLPIPEFLFNFLRELELNPTQIQPLGMGALVAWAVYMTKLRVPLTLENLSLLYIINRSPKFPFYSFAQKPTTSRFGHFTSSLGAVSIWSRRYLYIRYSRTEEVPEGVSRSQFLELPRLWNRGKLGPTLESFLPKNKPQWLDELEEVPEDKKWNPYAYVVEPVLYYAGLSRTEPVRYDVDGVDELGIYFFSER